MADTKVKTPLFHIAKRDPASMKWYTGVIVRIIAVVAALVVSGVLIMLLAKINPLEV